MTVDESNIPNFCEKKSNKNVTYSSTFTHPQAIQDVDEFISSWEQIWRNLALHPLPTN